MTEDGAYIRGRGSNGIRGLNFLSPTSLSDVVFSKGDCHIRISGHKKIN